jgi:AcrR family transcriptional regulator
VTEKKRSSPSALPRAAERSARNSKRRDRTNADAAPSLWAATKAIQRDARRDAILRAATRCINQRGYSGASMAVIARELGLSYNALYHYFESKEEILAQAFLRTNRLLRECVTTSATAPGPGLARMLAFVAAFQRLVRDESPPALALVAYLPQEKLVALMSGRAEIVDSLVRILREGMNDGSVRRGDPNVMVAFILGALESMPYWLFTPEIVASEFEAFVARALAA